MAAEDSTSRYLVIGGAGFLGSYIVQALIDRGERHVAVYDLKQAYKEDHVPGVSYFTGDVCDFEALLSVLKQVSVVSCCHMLMS